MYIFIYIYILHILVVYIFHCIIFLVSYHLEKPYLFVVWVNQLDNKSYYYSGRSKAKFLFVNLLLSNNLKTTIKKAP